MEEKKPTKQDLFVQEYLIDLNGKQAAIRAGYSPKTAEQISYQLLQKTSVQNAIARAMAERSRRTGINQDRVVRELAKIAFVKMTDVVNDECEIRPDADPDDLACIESVKVKQIPTKSGDVGVEREVRLSPKIKALELLGRHLGMFNDKLTLDGVVPVVITGDDLLED